MAAAAAVAPWQALLNEAMEANSAVKHSKYSQLATVRHDGKPANRTVVFRGYADGSERLQFTVDIRSQKVEEIQENCWVELCWYFTESWEQFRLLGQLELVGPSHPDAAKLNLREQAWKESSSKSLAQFAGPQPKDPRADDDAFVKEIDSSTDPLDTFGLLMLQPIQVDYLYLKKNQRLLFQKEDIDGQWSQQDVNP
eukprot:SM000050S17007  [mRNA]  locus=s50:300956:302927:- [translate_table: standard]